MQLGRRILFLVVALATILVTAPAWSAVILDTPTDLGALDGYTSSIARAVNASGQIAGESSNGFNDGRAFIWLPQAAYGLSAGLHDLGMLDGCTDSAAADINALGQVVGSCWDLAGARHAFIWLPVADYGLTAGMHPLSGLAGEVQSMATDINDAGQVVGDSFIETGNPPLEARGFIWQNGVATALTVSATDTTPIQVFGAGKKVLNESGQVIGRLQRYLNPGDENPTEYAVLWQSGASTMLTPAGQSAEAAAINENGEVVGRYGEALDVFLWLPAAAYGLESGCHLLAAEAGRQVANQIFVYDINDAGQIVGTCSSGSIWEPDPTGETEGTYIAVPGALWLWQNGAFTDVATMNESVNGFWINASGKVAGCTSTPTWDENWNFLGNIERAYLWSEAAGLQTLTTLGGTGIQVWAIGAAGQAIGTASLTGDTATHACAWGLPAPGNNPPVLADVPASATVDELAYYTFTATATDDDGDGDSLTFGMDGAPYGAAIDPTTGVFNWTPAEDQGPDSFAFSVSVTDGTDTVTQDITLTVNEVNQSPVLTNPGNQTVTEGNWLSFQLATTDDDVPAQTQAYSASSMPSGMTLDPATGLIAWKPTEEQGPGDYSVTILVSDGTDSDTVTFSVHVDESNQSPVLTAPANVNGTVGTPVTFTATATDPDLPANTLSFSLEANAPAGATIDPDTGAFTWTPTTASTFTFDVSVNDGHGDLDIASVSITVSGQTLGLTVSVVSVVRKGKTVTATVVISNPGTVAASNVNLTAATLGGSSTTTRLPVALRTLKAGASRSCSLKFNGAALSAGNLTLTVGGTSSLGAFSSTMSVVVP